MRIVDLHVLYMYSHSRNYHTYMVLRVRLLPMYVNNVIMRRKLHLIRLL